MLIDLSDIHTYELHNLEGGYYICFFHKCEKNKPIKSNLLVLKTKEGNNFLNLVSIKMEDVNDIKYLATVYLNLKRGYIEPIIKEEINPERTTLVLSFDKEKSNVTKGNNKKLNLSIQEIQILKYLEQNNQITRKEVEVLLDIKESRANSILKGKFNKKLLVKKGTTINSVYKLK